MFSIDNRNHVTFGVMAGLYVHIPFCKRACHYCDFHFSTNALGHHEMASAISDEVAMQRDYLTGDAVETIYFGGGTPSLLNPSQLERILAALFDNFQIDATPELTLEINPGSVTTEKLQAFRQLGVNRASFGAQ